MCQSKETEREVLSSGKGKILTKKMKMQKEKSNQYVDINA